MYITRIYIENFRSIQKIDITPNQWLNAFIGENSTWKSNIFKAMDWLLGKTYPTFNQTTKQDHFMWDEENNKIRIILEFSDWITFDLNENDNFKFRISGKDWRDIKTNDETRKRYCSAYLDTKREINNYMPSNKWSLLWRILQEVNSKFCQEKATINGEEKHKKDFLKDYLWSIKTKLLFSVKDENEVNIMEKLTHILQKETAEQLNRKEEEFFVDFNLYDPWNFYRTLQILVKEENGLQFQASDLWMWVQASISIAILKAYSELNLSNNSPIFIDEPELYLHPQAQRNFYKILRSIAEKTELNTQTWEYVFIGTQIFYTTHSPDFLNAWNFNEIFLVRKDKEKWTYIKNAKIKEFLEDLKVRNNIDSNELDFLLRMQNAYFETGDSQKANEWFFARKIILVEWQSETLILPYLFNLAWFDYIKEWITIVRCWSKDCIDIFYRLYNELWIPCYVIFDWDKQHIWTEAEAKTIQKNKCLFQIIDNQFLWDFPDGMAKSDYLWFEERIEDNLWIGEVWEGIKALNLFRRVKEKITKQADLPIWVNEMIEKIKSLPQEDVKSVLKLMNHDSN